MDEAFHLFWQGAAVMGEWMTKWTGQFRQGAEGFDKTGLTLNPLHLGLAVRETAFYSNLLRANITVQESSRKDLFTISNLCIDVFSHFLQ